MLIIIFNLRDVESVEHEDVVVVLGQGDDVALGGDLQAAAARYLHVRASELGQQLGCEKKKNIMYPIHSLRC